MKHTAIAIALSLVACGDDGSNPQTHPASAQQKAAVAALVGNLGDPDFDTPEASIGLANQVFAVGFLLAIRAESGGPGMQRGALGEECVTENGNVITYACPTINGTVTINGDSFDLDLSIIPMQGTWKSMKISGTITIGDDYQNGRLYFEVDTGTQSAAMTCDYEAWTAGESSRGWMTYTWSDPNVFGSEYQLIRVVWDGDDYTVTYE